MLIYNLNLLFVYTMVFIARFIKKNIYISNSLNTIAFMSLWIVSGLRYYVGTDYEMYNNYFGNISTIDFSNRIMEIGYYLLNKLINVFTNSEQMIFIVTSFIILYLIFKTILKYSEQAELSVYLFITMYFYYSSFNGVRQFIAISISFYCIRYLINKNFKKYILGVFAATLFHSSAIILIPFYFILNLNWSKKCYVAFFTVGVIGYVAINKIMNMIFILIPRYQKYIGSEFLSEETNWMHFVVIFGLLIFVLFYKTKLVKYNKVNIIYINAIFFATILQLLGMKTVLFSRMVYYLYIYAILLVPSCIRIFEPKLRPIIYMSVMVIYYLNSFVQLKVGISQVVPYIYRLPF